MEQDRDGGDLKHFGRRCVGSKGGARSGRRGMGVRESMWPSLCRIRPAHPGRASRLVWRFGRPDLHCTGICGLPRPPLRAAPVNGMGPAVRGNDYVLHLRRRGPLQRDSVGAVPRPTSSSEAGRRHGHGCAQRRPGRGDRSYALRPNEGALLWRRYPLRHCRCRCSGVCGLPRAQRGGGCEVGDSCALHIVARARSRCGVGAVWTDRAELRALGLRRVSAVRPSCGITGSGRPRRFPGGRHDRRVDDLGGVVDRAGRRRRASRAGVTPAPAWA